MVIGIVRTFKKTLFLFFSHFIFLGQTQNVYNDRNAYYNMDTTGFVTHGRWDPPDSVIHAWRERRRCVYIPRSENFPVYKGQDSMLTVFRGLVEMRELKLKNHKIKRTIRQSIGKYRKSPVLYMSEITHKLTSEERKKYLVLPDSSGFFVSIIVTEYTDNALMFRIAPIPNYYLYGYTKKEYERAASFTLSTSFSEDYIGCFYYDDILCIVCCDDRMSKDYKCCFFEETDNTITLHLYEKEIESLGYNYPYYYVKINTKKFWKRRNSRCVGYSVVSDCKSETAYYKDLQSAIK